jgi:beta-glucosidase/6-phospho-beta-glucosidase/beta-galactosidase
LVTQVSFKLNDNFGVPLDPKNNSHVAGANWFNSIQLGTFCNPVFLGIDYPESYKQTIKDYVPLSQEDLAYMNGTADFLGIDPYTATVVEPPSYGIEACANNQSEYVTQAAARDMFRLTISFVALSSHIA